MSSHPTEPATDLSQIPEHRLAIEGMTCQHCIGRVSQALAGIPGVSRVQVDLEQGRAKVSGGEIGLLIKAVEDAGYSAHEMQAEAPACPVPASGAEPLTPPREIPDSYRLMISDMTCASCVARVERTIRSVPGVTDAAVNLVEQQAQVAGGDPQAVVAAVIDQGYPARLLESAKPAEALLLSIVRPDGDVTQEALLGALSDLDSTCEIHPEDSYWRLGSNLHPARILHRLAQAGYQVRVIEEFEDPHAQQAAQARREIRLAWQRALVAGLLGVGLMVGDMAGWLPALESARGVPFWSLVALLCLAVMTFSGRNYYIGAWKQARHHSTNMDTLVALGTGAAWISSVLMLFWHDLLPGGVSHLYFDASVLILAFLQLGHGLEIRAKRTTSEAISSLLELAPKTAHVMLEGEPIELPVSLLRLHDVIRVRPGERVPIDAEVVEGSSSVDEAMLTGESAAVKKQPGDAVIGGTINQNGALLCRVTRLGDETTLAQIIRMVRQAQISKPPIGRLVDQVAAVFVPTVILIALLTFAGWSLWGPEPQMTYALTASIAVLVIACPCALGLATPIAIMVGMGRAAQLNILIRNSEALQRASALTHLVVDKTGTLTQGRPAVTAIHSLSGATDEEVLKLAASLEANSAHPLAEPILRAARERRIESQPATEFEAIDGAGLSGRIGGEQCYLGSPRLLHEQEIELPEIEAGSGTAVWLAHAGRAIGLLVLQDPIRHDSSIAIGALHRQGVKVVMCTGDNRRTAQSVADALGIDEVYSELLPADKLQVVRALQELGYRVGMVGDGVNDAPALAQADTGFAIGSGSDVAVENADITLAGDSLLSVSDAIAISSATLRNIKQNLFGAFIYNTIGIPLAAGALFPFTGWLLPPMFASAAMALSSVTVVTNANRLRFFQATYLEKPVTMKLKISGMTCPHCVKSVKTKLEQVAGVEAVEVSLENGMAQVSGNASVEGLISAVKEAGYSAESAD